MNCRLKQEFDHQIFETDADAHSMSTSGRGTGMVGYNVQTAVDIRHYLIVAHEITNLGQDRSQLACMTEPAQEMTRRKNLIVIADRGYFSDLNIMASEERGAIPLAPILLGVYQSRGRLA